MTASSVPSGEARIPLSRVAIDAEIRDRVLEAVDSGRYILGPQCAAFERELAAHAGLRYAVLVSSGTAALMLALVALGVGEGDEVLVPSHTAFPTVEAIFQVGARPVFVDIGETYTLDPAELERRLTSRVKAVVPVHLYGHPCDLDPIVHLARREGLLVLEDCAQAHGALYRGRRVGGFGHAGVHSFYPSKNLTVLGDGGAVVTDDGALAERVRALRDHGRREKLVHAAVGWNLRFNEIQAAAGRVLLRRLDEGNARRRAAAALYRELLDGLPIALPPEGKWAEAVYHLYVVATPARDALREHLAGQGIETGIHYPLPCHRQPATLAQPRVRSAELPRTDRACSEVLSLPMFPDLSDVEIARVARAVRSFFEADPA
jgi:dTDP-4-amino-4,6-dideoxygalactose transaminase